VARYTSSRWCAPLALLAFGCAAGGAWVALHGPFEAASAGFAGVIGGIVLFVVSAVFTIVAIGLAALALQPAIEIHETHLVMTGVIRGVVGNRAIPWEQIRRVEQARWQTSWQTRWSVLSVVLTLDGGSRLLVVHAGSFDSGRSLLRHLRHCAREALLDGIPYRQFWGQDKSERGAPEQPRSKHPGSEHPQSEHARSEYARPEGINPDRLSSERTPLRARLGEADAPAAPFRYPLLLAEDEAEIEHMFQRLKAGRLDPQSHDTDDIRDTRGDASLDSRASGEGQG
jgi:hypothetical protein